MKVKLLLLVLVMSSSILWSQSKVFWQQQSFSSSTITKSSHQSLKTYQTFTLNAQALKQVLANAPQRNFSQNGSNLVLSFPNSEGKLERFAIMEASVMHPDLQARYPNIRSYVGQGVDDATSRIRFSLTPQGFNGMILSGNGPGTFIEPIARNSNNYIIFKRQNRVNFNDNFECQVTAQLNASISSDAGMRNADDSILRTYRLAVSTTGEYTQYHGGSVSQALAAINTTMTRVNGLFENDFNVTMVLIPNNDAIIYTNGNTDPYSNGSYNNQVQNVLTNIIGEANYDVGHLFARASDNGNAGCIGCVCVNGQKGSAFTSRSTPEGDPFDVDYVAHELGHQFGGNHTFSFRNEGTNAHYEPGSGSTIMGYAGITGSTDVQSVSDPYFHWYTIQQVTNYVKTTNCQVNTNTGNSIPTVSAGPNFTIPRGTPFVLEGTASDNDIGDILTYCWEQADENDASTTFPSTNSTSGVSFRSFNPSTDNKRYFPRLSTIKTGATAWQWEAIPNVSRTLNFRLTVRDNRAGGATNNSDDTSVTVNGSAGPFILNSPNTNVTWDAGTTRTVTWDVAGTTGNGINATNVDIFLSTDGGDTYPITLATGVPNDGSHDIVVPNNEGNQNRVMVKGANNIFFDISNTNFTIGPPVVCNATIPTGLVASNVATTTATLSWNAVPGASYDLRFREVGTSTWTTESVTGISSSLSSLTALTQYEAQVRSTCSGGATSAYSGLVNFTTTDVQLNYCDSASTNVNDEYISRLQLNTIDNSSGAQFYSDFTNISTSLTKGTQYSVTITPTWTGTVYSEGYSVWIDYNRDGDFSDAGEQVFTQAPTQATPVSGSFTVPTNAVENSTRMRVTLSYNANVGPCDSFQYGEVEDYTIIIQAAGPDEEAPSSPTDLTASNTTETSTDLNWTAATDNVGVSNYDVYQDGVQIANVIGTSVQVTGLSESTTYSFYVIANDVAGNSSPQSNIVNETTLSAPTCSDGIQNGDETGVDCGGSSCAPCATSTLNEGFFETGLDGWTDGGSDVARVQTTNSYEGIWSIRIRDNSGTASSMTSPTYDLSDYESVEISFFYYPVSMENGEDFWLQFNDGSGWTTVATYVSGTDFTNRNFFNDSVTVTNSQFSFGPSAQFRLRCDASGNNDQVYIDQVITVGTLSGSDVTPPVITLNGVSNLDLNVGDTYTEQGATATDNVDGDLTGSIVIGGDVVNTSVAGTYLVTYNVSDAAGNAANEVVRTVNVIPDTTAPVITLNGASTVNLNVGDTYTELGATATDNIDGDISANIVIGGDVVDGNTAGTYLVTYNVSDDAGNAATEVVRTVNVILDTTAPVITLIGASSISLELGDSFSEPGATATDNVDGDITANIVVGGDTVDSNTAGTYIITYNVSDAAGNTATQVTRTVTVNPDTTIPVITLNGLSVIDLIEGDTYTELGATATDNIDGDITANIVIGGDVVDTNAVGTYLVTYNVSDAAGNAANEVTRTINVSVAPTCNDGIQNGDETGIDCGGSCAPCSPTDVILNEGYFETGLDSWIDGGSDCARRLDEVRSFEGQYSIRIRDNSGVASSMTLNNIDVSSFSTIEVDFYFYVRSMENGEDFWLRFFDGSSWFTVETWTRGVNINNNTFYNATVSITPSQYNFAVNSGFRFQCDASGNNDQIFIDQVTITGLTISSRGRKDKLEIVGYGEPEELSEFDISIYPNPVKGNIMNIEVSGVETFGYSIIDIVGKTVLKGKTAGSINVSKLDGGVYFIKVNDGDEIITKKFIKN